MVLLTRRAFYLDCISISVSGLIIVHVCFIVVILLKLSDQPAVNSRFHTSFPFSHNKVLSVTLLRYRMLTVGFILLVPGF